MKRLIFAMTALSALLPVCGATYEVDFSNGKFPSKVLGENANGLIPVAANYQRGYTRFGWIVARFENEYVAMSPTSTDSPQECENRLTFPKQQIDESSMLRWTSRSLLDILPESYTVEAVVDGLETPVVLATIYKEPAVWTTHILPLKQLAGKTAAIRIVCNSTDKYMLMLRNILIGDITEPSLEVKNFTPAYTDMSNQQINLSVYNTGSPTNYDAAICIINGEEVSRQTFDSAWTTGSVTDVSLPAVASLNERTSYEVWLEKDGVLVSKLAEGSYFSSNFVRRHLVDKGTGTWCTNCPDGMLLLEQLEVQLGESLVAVETHTGNDPMANSGYWSELGFYAAPYFKLDRIAATAQSNLSLFAPYYDVPVTMAIDVAEVTADFDHATVRLNVKALEDFNNTDDRYRIGYVLIKDYYRPGNNAYRQQSNINTPSGGRFYILPSPVSARFIEYRNVSLTSAEAFGGIANSIPQTVPADGADFEVQFDCPDVITNLAGVNIAAFIIDTQTGHIMNAAKAEILDRYAGIKESKIEDANDALSYLGNGTFRINISGEFALDIYDLTGRHISTSNGLSDGNAIITRQLSSGLYIARLSTATSRTSIKIAL